MKTNLYLMALGRTADDGMQLFGTIGAFALAAWALSGLVTVGNPFALLLGAGAAFVKPRVWIHGPLAALALYILGTAGEVVSPLAILWISAFFLALLVRNFGDVSNKPGYSQTGVLLMIGSFAGFLVSLSS